MRGGVAVGEEDGRNESLSVGLQIGLGHIVRTARIVPVDIDVLVLLGRRFLHQDVVRPRHKRRRGEPVAVIVQVKHHTHPDLSKIAQTLGDPGLVLGP